MQVGNDISEFVGIRKVEIPVEGEGEMMGNVVGMTVGVYHGLLPVHDYRR